MEIGRVAEIDNAKENYSIKTKQVNLVDEKEKVVDNEEYKKNSPKDTKELNEVILDNIQFGYNKSSKDFFVKITRGDIENKYPTEDMMKIKAFLLEELEKNLENK